MAGGTPAFLASRVLGARASRSHEGRNALLGNAASKHARKKATYPALFGIEQARAYAQQAMEDAITALQPFDNRADPLRWLAIFAVERGR